ncbi:MAG: HAD family hydrolase [Erysipelotrichaceae bacterium]|jgi:putative hydrolase of the HAD superfamily
MIKAILFDYDGTLADRTKGACTAFRSYLKEYVIKDEIYEVYLEALVQDLLLWDEFGAGNKRLMIERFNSKYGYNINYDHFFKWWCENLGLFEPLFKNTLKTLNYLKGKYKLGIITNGTVIGQNTKIDNADIRHYFDTIIISDEFGKAKPDRLIFKEALKQLNVLPKEAIYVGDSYSNDIIGAYNAKITPVWIWPDDGRYDLHSTKRIYKIEELMEIL